jgi:hypothetical protein
MDEDELRRGLLAILFLPDREAAWLAPTAWRWPLVREARDAYGSDSPWLRFRPSPQDVTIAEQLEAPLCVLTIAEGKGATRPSSAGR